MPIAITNTLVNGNVVDAPQLNTNFQDLAQPLNGTEDMDIIIAHTDAVEAPLTVNQKGAGPIAVLMQNSVAKVTIENSGQIDSTVATGTPPIDVDSTTLCPNLNADKLDDRHAIEWKISFAPSFTINDPSTANLNSREFGSIVIPAGGSHFITKTKVMFRNGSHMAGGSLTFKVDRAFVGDISTLSLNDTNNTAATLYTDDIADLAVPEGAIINCYISARSGTINERDVSIIVEGYRTLF